MRWIVLLPLLLAQPAQATDWSRAGGGLFVGASASEDSPAGPAPSCDLTKVPAPVEPYAAAIDAAARAHGLDPKLLHALVIVESGYHARARSRAGAQGLSQLMPTTSAENGIHDVYDPRENLSAGARVLSAQILRFHDLRLALAAYNAGPRRVAELGQVPPFAETRAYVTAVIDCYLALSAGRSPRIAGDCPR